MHNFLVVYPHVGTAGLIWDSGSYPYCFGHGTTKVKEKKKSKKGINVITWNRRERKFFKKQFLSQHQLIRLRKNEQALELSILSLALKGHRV